MQKALSSASFSAIVGLRIRRAREKAGVNQQDLGRLIHRDDSTISRIEAGKCRVQLEVVWAIAQALTIDYNSLIEIKKLSTSDLAGILCKYPEASCLIFVASEQVNLAIIDFVVINQTGVQLIAVPTKNPPF